jgi:ssDNA-binding replication factor A large subunit
VRVRVSKKKTKIEETQNSLLIPADLKVVDLVKAFKVTGNVSGLFEIPESSRNIQTTDTRTATELGWRHGT